MHYLVAGLAKTGTTALFTSIKNALPADTPTFFEPQTPAQFTTILDTPTTTLTKALLGYIKPEHQFLNQFHPHILILRDSRDQIISQLLYNFYDFKLHNDPTGYQQAHDLLKEKIHNPQTINTIDLYNHIAKLVHRPGITTLTSKIQLQLDYRAAFQPHVIHYEDFITGNTAALETYLGFSITKNPEVDIAVQRVARSKSCGEWRAWFTASDLTYINDTVGPLLTQLGYPLETQATPAQTLPITTTLDYIEQFKPDNSTIRRIIAKFSPLLQYITKNLAYRLQKYRKP